MANKTLSILKACDDQRLFGQWFSKTKHQQVSWSAWMSFLRVLFGLPLRASDMRLFEKCTGRTMPPKGPFNEAWLIVGRRGGKSLVLAVVAVYLALFRSWTQYLAPGERAMVLIIAADQKQARTIFNYIKGFIYAVPMLKERMTGQTKQSIDLKGRVTIEIQTASFRSVRGYTMIAVLCDEIAFWRDETYANPDAEILNALRPGMATVPGSMLLCASSPFSRRGELYNTHRDYWGKNGGDVLVWQADTKTMNPSFSDKVIQKAYDRDASRAAAEYGGSFRSDLEALFRPEVIQASIVPNRISLPYLSEFGYFAFVDPSGGSGKDAMTLAIGHTEWESGIVTIDCTRRVVPPFAPKQVVSEFAQVLKSYHIFSIMGDRFGGDWPRERFREHGIDYEVSAKNKSELFLDLLQKMNSTGVELLDDIILRNELEALERRAGRARDTIDHPPNMHDDLANAVAGVASMIQLHAVKFDDEHTVVAPTLVSHRGDFSAFDPDSENALADMVPGGGIDWPH